MVGQSPFAAEVASSIESITREAVLVVDRVSHQDDYDNDCAAAKAPRTMPKADVGWFGPISR